MPAALIACLALQGGWLTQELVEAEAPWFTAPWHRYEHQAFESAIKSNRPVLFWTPAISFHKQQSEKSLQERLALTSAPDAMALLHKGVEPVIGPGYSDAMGEWNTQPGVHIFLPDGTHVGSTKGLDISNWPRVVRQAAEIIAKHQGQWDEADLSVSADFPLYLDTSVWCRSSAGRGSHVGYRVWRTNPDIWEQILKSRSQHDFIAKDFVRSCLYDSTLPSQFLWRDQDFSKLEIQQTSDRELAIEVKMESGETHGASARFVMSYPKEGKWVRISGKAMLWTKDEAGLTERTLEFVSSPKTSLPGQGEDK